MAKEQICEKVIRTNYSAIYRYCLKLLSGDVEAAEDCTQNTFLLMYEKRTELDFDRNIKSWIYAVADRIVMDYLAKEKRRREMIAGDIDDWQDKLEEPFQAELEETVLDSLTEEEYHLLDAYYSAAYGSRKQLAEEMGLSVAQLYKQVHMLRDRLRGSDDLQSDKQGK